MKKSIALLLISSTLLCFLAGCNSLGNGPTGGDETPSVNTDLGGSDDTFGEELAGTGVYDGYFEEKIQDLSVECISGTANAYEINGNVLTFSGISEDTVYSISGKLNGNIIIDVSENFKFELELKNFSLVSSETNPIQIKNGDKITLTAKKDTKNYIYDMRDAVDESDETVTKGAIYSAVDLKIGGKGSLSVVSENNNGIHTKDDLEVKNLTLTVACEDNALKGNDGVEINSGIITLISKSGDGIKTSNSGISTKENQKGTVNILGGELTVYAACDGIDSAYNTVIDGENAIITIYTDKYSNYSKEVTVTASSTYYIRFSSNSYKYSIKYYNSDSDYEWVNATYHSTVSGGYTNYYYHSFPKKTGYENMQFFIYSSDMEQGQENEYLAVSDYFTPHTTYDTIALSSKYNGLTYTWTNYTTSIQGGMGPGGMGGMGPGGMNDGNSDKGDHSTKGIKAANEIIINKGTVNIKSYDDSLHADNSVTLENGEPALGNITVNGGTLTLYSNDDGIHAENAVYINGGIIQVANSYEGVEGAQVFISDGDISIYAKDDGINSTATSGTGITLSGGFLYIYCTGDGIDANSLTKYSGISFEGGDAIIISNSGMNSAIDNENGYKYTAGNIVAIMPSGGMKSESQKCENFSSVGTSKNMNLKSGSILTVSGSMNKTVTMPCSINAFVVILNKDLSVSN